MVEHPADYDWSSYRHNTGIARTNWLDERPELLAVHTDTMARQEAYAEFVGLGISNEERELIKTALNRNQVTGNDLFRKELERRTGRRQSTAGPGRLRK